MAVTHDSVAENLVKDLRWDGEGNYEGLVYDEQKDQNVRLRLDGLWIHQTFNHMVEFINCLRTPLCNGGCKFMKLRVYDGRDNEEMDLMKLDVSPFCHKLKYRQKKNEATCVITNIMNTLDIIGDKKNINKVLPCLDGKVWQRMCAQESEKISTGNDNDNLNAMLQMLRRNSYYINKVKKKRQFYLC